MNEHERYRQMRWEMREMRCEMREMRVEMSKWDDNDRWERSESILWWWEMMQWGWWGYDENLMTRGNMSGMDDVEEELKEDLVYFNIAFHVDWKNDRSNAAFLVCILLLEFSELWNIIYEERDVHELPVTASYASFDRNGVLIPQSVVTPWLLLSTWDPTYLPARNAIMETCLQIWMVDWTSNWGVEGWQLYTKKEWIDEWKLVLEKMAAQSRDIRIDEGIEWCMLYSDMSR